MRAAGGARGVEPDAQRALKGALVVDGVRNGLLHASSVRSPVKPDLTQIKGMAGPLSRMAHMSAPISGTAVLRAFPVLVPCQGCAEFGRAARDVALLLERRGFGELAPLGTSSEMAATRTKVKGRYPIFCLDACDKGCARAWLANEGVRPQCCFVLSGSERGDVDLAARRIAGDRLMPVNTPPDAEAKLGGRQGGRR